MHYLQLYHALFTTSSCISESTDIYGIIIRENTFPFYLKRLKITLQNEAIKIVDRCQYRDGATSFYSRFKMLQIDDLWKYEIAKFVHSTICNITPNSFRNYFLKSAEYSNRATRQSTDNKYLNIPAYRTTKLLKCIKYQGVKVWNTGPQEITSFSFKKLKLHYKKFLLAQYCN